MRFILAAGCELQQPRTDLDSRKMLYAIERLLTVFNIIIIYLGGSTCESTASSKDLGGQQGTAPFKVLGGDGDAYIPKHF